MDVKEQSILGPDIDKHWYYVAKGRAMLRFLGDVPRDSVLDVGAGSGVFSKTLLEHGSKESVCVDTSYSSDHLTFHHGKQIQFVRAIDGSSADLVLMMDVCEHVDDDSGLIRRYADLVGPHAHFLITVPAFQFLFSRHDVFLDHKRRYTISLLEKAVENAGLRVIRSVYYFATVFPIAASQRLVEKLLFRAKILPAKSSLKTHSLPVNRALLWMSMSELSWFRYNRFCGLTIFCLAEKPTTGPLREV